MLAVANYHDAYGSYPPAFVAGPDGAPMHSWRLLILPYLGKSDLYNAYNFAQPWNGPDNRKLAGRVDSLFLRSGLNSAQTSSTSFVAVVGPEAAWRGSQPVRTSDLADGTHDTIMVVEVPEGRFHWMEPRDLEFGTMSFRINDGSPRGLGSRLGGARVGFADASIRTLPDDSSPAELRALLTANGHEPTDRSRLQTEGSSGRPGP